MSYKVNPQDLTKISLNESGVVSSVLQNIAILLSTRQQTVPLCRDFGLPQKFIDKPVSVAKQLMIAEIREAILAFEPRATLLGVTFTEDENVPGRLIPTVEVDINEQ